MAFKMKGFSPFTKPDDETRIEKLRRENEENKINADYKQAILKDLGGEDWLKTQEKYINHEGDPGIAVHLLKTASINSGVWGDPFANDDPATWPDWYREKKEADPEYTISGDQYSHFFDERNDPQKRFVKE